MGEFRKNRQLTLFCWRLVGGASHIWDQGLLSFWSDFCPRYVSVITAPIHGLLA